MPSTVRSLIAASGGIADTTDLARRWNVTRQRAAQITQDPEFPDPIALVGGRRVWLVDETDEYRARPRRLGRPPRAA